MRSHFSTQADFGTILLPTILQGAAMGFFFIPLQAIIFSGMPPEKMAAAAGLSNFTRITAGAIGTSLFTTVWEHRAAMHHAHLVEHIAQGRLASDQVLAQLGAGGQSGPQALAVLERMIDVQAYTMAATDLFHLSSVLFLVLIGLIWLARPAKGNAAGDGGAH
jgi:DHA2 family multidrug resistance protein